MSYAFITNSQSPTELADLIDRYKEDEGYTNLDYVLDEDAFDSLEWTVDKDAKIGDLVFFMCAKTSADHMGHVCAEARRNGDEDIIDFAEEKRKLYKRYAGKIVAIGTLMTDPYQEDNKLFPNQHWRSPWYAKISAILRLVDSVDISEFREFITVSRTGAITKLDKAQTERLYGIVMMRQMTNELAD